MCPPGRRLCYFMSTRSSGQNASLFNTFRQIWGPLRYQHFYPQNPDLGPKMTIFTKIHPILAKMVIFGLKSGFWG